MLPASLLRVVLNNSHVKRKVANNNNIFKANISTQSLNRDRLSKDKDEKIESVRLAGRLRFFTDKWGKITTDKFILKSINGHKIPFSKTSPSISFPRTEKMVR